MEDINIGTIMNFSRTSALEVVEVDHVSGCPLKFKTHGNSGLEKYLSRREKFTGFGNKRFEWEEQVGNTISLPTYIIRPYRQDDIFDVQFTPQWVTLIVC